MTTPSGPIDKHSKVDELDKAGFLLILKISTDKNKGYYIEHCKNMRMKLEHIKRDSSNKAHKYFASMEPNPLKAFIKYDEDGIHPIGLDYDNWWQLNRFKVYSEEKLFNHYPFMKDENIEVGTRLSMFVDNMTAKGKWTCYNAVINNTTNAKVKREFRRMTKIPCPFCGRFVSRYNMARHKQLWCKEIKSQ